MRTVALDTIEVDYLEQLSCSLWSLADCFKVAAYSCILFAASPAGEGSVTSVARHRGIGFQGFVVAGGRQQSGGKTGACRGRREKLRRLTSKREDTGQPRSLILAIVIMVISCCISETVELLYAESHLSAYPTPVPVKISGCSLCRRLYADREVIVPARHQATVPARATLLSTKWPTGDTIVETRQMQPGVYLGRTLLPPGNRDLCVNIVNTTAEPKTVAVGEWLGNLHDVEVPSDQEWGETSSDQQPNGVVPTSTEPVDVRAAAASSTSTGIVDSLLQQLPDSLDAEQCQQVGQLMQNYQDIFSTGTYDMGRTNLVEHEINTGNHPPIRQGLRRHPTAHLDVIDEQVHELVRNDLIEPAASPWAANVVLVRKKDGTYRLCLDYRALNAVTYQDTYPLPHIDTCLGSMDGATWFSTLDLRSGYHNIPICDRDKDKTAFITRRGCFRYKVLPFGLTTAPSVFQRLMDLVLCGLTYVTCLVYLDDIIVFAKDFNTHLSRLAEVFERLKQAGLKLHGTKCSLFRRRVSFLGHVLSGDGIEVQAEKVKAVRDWPVPKNISELRSYLGMVSYYRKFIPGFANIAAPLA